jgi:nucleotide-binding universal stress UspA family protein
MTKQGIVIGYDRSAGAEAGLQWALEEGARTHAPVTLVCAFVWRTVTGSITMAPTLWPDDSVREAAQNVIAAALARAGKTHPQVAVSGEVVCGDAAAVLVEKSRRTRLVVLSEWCQGGLADLLVGSISSAVSAHAHCPVVVVRADRLPAGGPIVVGYDGSDRAELAVEFAIAQAAGQGASLRLVQAWKSPARWESPGVDPQERIAVQQADLNEVTSRWQDQYPQLQASAQVVVGPAGKGIDRGQPGCTAGRGRLAWTRKLPRVAAGLGEPAIVVSRALPCRRGPQSSRCCARAPACGALGSGFGCPLWMRMSAEGLHWP